MVGDLLQFYSIAFELVVGYVSLFAVTKILGKSLITQITPFDFITSIVLSELVGNALYDQEVGASSIVFAIAIWGLLMYCTEWVTQKYRGTRGFIEGSPSILIKQGKLSFYELKKNHLDINQLQHLLRSNNVFSMREAEYAILEADGTLNVLKKSAYDVPTKQDYDYPKKPVYLPVTLITDGEVLWDNLAELGYSRTWFAHEINKYNLTFEKVLYAEWLEGDGLFLQEY